MDTKPCFLFLFVFIQANFAVNSISWNLNSSSTHASSEKEGKERVQYWGYGLEPGTYSTSIIQFQKGLNLIWLMSACTSDQPVSSTHVLALAKKKLTYSLLSILPPFLGSHVVDRCWCLMVLGVHYYFFYTTQMQKIKYMQTHSPLRIYCTLTR